ncbi:hypothetical protein GCM10023191_088100 [Actinoallomurus oryzae]|uniref:Uncharacterized protein n=1 Tax=Actinoallomurus oryzae TaxID=502180 RepID=A0ABP8R2S5_9ACTN
MCSPTTVVWAADTASERAGAPGQAVTARTAAETAVTARRAIRWNDIKPPEGSGESRESIRAPGTLNRITRKGKDFWMNDLPSVVGNSHH